MKIEYKPKLKNFFLQRANLAPGASGQRIVLDSGRYDHTSAEHREALSFIPPQQRPEYFIALQRAVNIQIVHILLNARNILLVAIFEQRLFLPELLMKLRRKIW